VPIKKQTWDALKKRMEELGIQEDELEERFILGSGSGGQKINKTYNTVYLKHLPSGIEVKCQRERSRELNRYYARRDLCDKLEEKAKGELSIKRQKIEKIRRQKQRRKRKTQKKLIEEKRIRTDIKEGRKKIRPTEDN